MSARDASKGADVIVWAIRVCAPNALPSDMGSLRHAVDKLLEGEHAGAYGQCPDYGSTYDPCPDACASGVCASGGGADLWIERTWADVLAGDFVRPPGIASAEAEVTAIGPVVAWGVNDLQPLDAYQQRDIQYNPGKYAGTYAVRRATLVPIGGGVPITREMKPDAAVEIRVTAAELKVIEAWGGFPNRVAIIGNQE